ncbi:xylulokinase [Alicyclobacillus dauci]|uniref:Xylulose kinase n=1 Tax=Alicyclobacillus dauci TaxID=1475485 RepID=A0ABY6Z920_9BACL|nr:xylulokinase [Alicyclobacillus dauci]WAH36359.1 xylulokinase [Alicyclobacillus dauci]WAH39375.1 xylulokinase [Alicyclobacillus dauci]
MVIDLLYKYNSRKKVTQMKALLGLDLGTSAAKCLVMDLQGKVLGVASTAYPTYTPQPGWVEQKPIDWWHACVNSVRACLREIPSTVSIEGIALSGHMSALCMVDSEGNALLPSITLSDTRSETQTSWLGANYRDKLVGVSGNVPIDALLLPKLLWVKETLPEVLATTHRLLFPKDYLLYRLTGRFVTEPTDAGNSMVYDVQRGKWDDDLIRQFGLPTSVFPDVVDTTEQVGDLLPEAASVLGLQPGVPVVAGGADMACSALGTGAVSPGVVSITIGTAAQVLTTVPAIHRDGIGKITFHRHALPQSFYALGSIFTGGLAMNWLSSVLFDRSSGSYQVNDIVKLGELASTVAAKDSALMFLPFLVGRGSPKFSADARACFIGLSAHTRQGALARAVMEGVSFNILECLDVFAQMGNPITRVHMGGGGSKLAVWRSILADVLGIEIHLMETRDASAIGAAIIAGVGIGAYPDVATAANTLVHTGEVVVPSLSQTAIYNKKYQTYRKLIESISPLFSEIANS